MAQNTPTSRPERIRKAPMYWLTRSVITCQAEMTTISVVNAVSSTNQTERPSTPSVYQTLKRPIQACRSPNCSAAVARSNWVTSGIVTAKLAAAAPSANQRTAPACWSLPKASNSTPARIGNQIARLSRGMFLLWVGAALAADQVA